MQTLYGSMFVKTAKHQEFIAPVSTYPRRLSSNPFLVTFPLTCMETKHPKNGVELIFQNLSSNEIDILHLNRIYTQHPNNVVDLILFQLYCHLVSNPNVNTASRRLSTRPDDLTQVLVPLV